jgi:hypothetical protein
VLAATEAARHTNGAALGIGRDDRVHPIDPARAAVVFNGVTGAVRSGAWHDAHSDKNPAVLGASPFSRGAECWYSLVSQLSR